MAGKPNTITKIDDTIRNLQDFLVHFQDMLDRNVPNSGLDVEQTQKDIECFTAAITMAKTCRRAYEFRMLVDRREMTRNEYETQIDGLWLSLTTKLLKKIQMTKTKYGNI